VSQPERLNIETVREELARRDLAFDLRYLHEVDSTNRALVDLPEGELRHGVALVTEYQSAGRGRLGRQWRASPKSSLLLSVALQLGPEVRSTDVVMVAGLSVVDAILDVTGLSSSLKWPNDVLLRGRKTCGILAEVVRRRDVPYAVVGIGLNVNLTEAELLGIAGYATSLLMETGGQVTREPLLVSLLTKLDEWYRRILVDSDGVFRVWRDRLGTMGARVVVDEGGVLRQGVARDVQRDGGLLLEMNGGQTRVVYAGDVTLMRNGDFTTVG
jgi:BirA family biotin operon repressor/biotin-[acetyl-CoA-carboxylase] ligase